MGIHRTFVGAGAFFFYLKNHYTIKQAVLLDRNPQPHQHTIIYKTILLM